MTHITELVIDSSRRPPSEAQTSRCCFRLVLALPTSSTSDSSSSPVWLSERRQSEILASLLKQLLITGSGNVVATTSLPGFSLAESRPALIQTCSLGELWPRSDPITSNLFLCQDLHNNPPPPNISPPRCGFHHLFATFTVTGSWLSKKVPLKMDLSDFSFFTL